MSRRAIPTAGDLGEHPHRARQGGRGRPRGRRAVLGSACGRSGHSARDRARARGGHDAARHARSRPRRAPLGRHADRALHLRQPGAAHGSGGLRARGRGRRRGRRADPRLPGRRGRSRCARRWSMPGSIRSSWSARRRRTGGSGDRASSGAGSCTSSRGSASPACATASPTTWRRSWRGSGRSRRCPSRSDSASRRPSMSREACASADAAVVGSALVNVIAEHGAAPDVAERAGEYVRWLKSACEPHRRASTADRRASTTQLVELLSGARGVRARGRPRKEAGRARGLSAVARSGSPRITSSESIRGPLRRRSRQALVRTHHRRSAAARAPRRRRADSATAAIR